MSLLTRNGYIVEYDDLTPWHIKELTVVAEKSPPYDTDLQPFPVFEDRLDGTVSVPRYWGEDNFGRPKKLFGRTSKTNRLEFRGELRDFQKSAASSSIKQLECHGGGVLSVPTGFGKCHGIDTPIIMYDGSVKMVQDVEVGDLLMGDDSTARRVLSLARGRDNMYDIVPVKGDKYTVNHEHVLVLKNINKRPYIHKRLYKKVERFYVMWWENLKLNKKVHYTIESAKLFLSMMENKHESVVEIKVKDYIAQSKTFKRHYKGYRTSVDFSEIPVPIDPYMIGVWLGEDVSRGHQIMTNYLISKYGLSYGYGITNNKFFNVLKQLNMIGNKHIPIIYKCNSRKNRLSLLAGILDINNCLTHNGYFDLIQKSNKLIDDIIYLCRSLGFACYKFKQTKNCRYKSNETNLNNNYSKRNYYRITISGEGVEKIPTLIHSKQATKRKSAALDVLVTGIKVKHIGIGNYYGFTLDGNSRYVLGDFTVTHNTVLSLYVACAIKVKTLVVVHKQFLLDQWEEKIKTFVPFARIGRLQKDIEDVDCDIVVGMLQSIAMRQYDDDVFSDFGLVIFDEVHVVPAPVFSRALLKLSAPYLLGLSATPVRKDGLSRVIHWFIGPTFFEHLLTGKNDVTVEVVDFKLSRTIPYNIVAATTIICNIADRNEMLVSKVKKLVSAGHKVILLSDRRAHCEALKLKLKSAGTDSALYLGGMKPFELEKSTKKDVLLCTYGIAKEGLDVPTLDALVLATPRSDVVQACGRILHGKTSLLPVIIDVVDQWSVGKAQYRKRCAYYKSAGFTIK